MAELNDKLITYGNLSTFYDKLQEQGLGGNAIEDASVLPDASENKSKLIRLESDDNVYVSELKSRTSTTTNRLPDEQQIDKAYINYSEYEYAWKYKGDGYKIICSDGEINGYGWFCDERPWYPYVSWVNAENLQDFKDVATADNVIFIDDNNFATIDDKTFSTSDSVEYTKHNHLAYDVTYVPATYNAPEANQIGNATIEFTWWESGTTYNDTFVYDGTSETITVNNEQFTGYKWISDNYPNIHMLTNLQASNIYHSTSYSEQHGYSELAPDLYCYAVKNGVSGYCSCEHIIIPQLNAPDSEQVDNANITTIVGSDETIYSYTGQLYTIKLSDDSEELQVYWWNSDNDDLNLRDFHALFSIVNANSIYSEIQNAFIYITDDEGFISITGNVITLETPDYVDCLQCLVSSINMLFKDEMVMDSVVLSTTKYQRTEVTEEWDWQPLTDNATNDDIDFMFVKEIKLIRAQEDDENYIDWLVNTSGETMEFNGQTYYKWVVWGNDFNDGSGPAVEHPNVLVLTNTLNVQLPFNSNSPEFECRISIEDEGMTSQDYIHGDYTQKTVQ